MASRMNRERILEAIDQLRRRKARPDVQRICNYLFRKFSVNSAEARTDLQWCVDNDVVLKVEYKGNTSYRNAAKKFSQMKRTGHHSDEHGQNHQLQQHDSHKANRKFAQLLTNAFGELVVHDPDYLEFGVPADHIIEKILSKDSVRYTKKYISILLEKEVENGGLVRKTNGNYEMGPIGTEDGSRRVETYERNSGSGGQVQVEKEMNDSADVIITDAGARKEFPIIHLKPRGKPGPKVISKPGSRESSVGNVGNNTTNTAAGNKNNNKEGREKLENNGENSMDSDERKSESGQIRVGVRRKRAKKVFDPSDVQVPRKRGRPAGSLNKTTIEKQIARMTSSDQESSSRPDSRLSNGGREQGGVCSVCHLQNKRGPNESMVACRECSNKAHYSCLNGDDMMLRMYPDNTWQCPHCKTCITCYETADAGTLIVCSVCADAYHAGCHQPPIVEKIKNGMKWLCVNCEMPKELELHDIQSNIGNHTYRKSGNSSSSRSSSSSPACRSLQSSPLPPQLSPQGSNSGTRQSSPDRRSESPGGKDSDLEEGIDPSIPDATHWTYQEVYQYFAQYFPNEAKVFRDQEIDGRSLLLMKRMDVLKNLKLKLGPALKIYRHVVKLQVRKDDPKYYWL